MWFHKASYIIVIALVLIGRDMTVCFYAKYKKETKTNIHWLTDLERKVDKPVTTNLDVLFSCRWQFSLHTLRWQENVLKHMSRPPQGKRNYFITQTCMIETTVLFSPTWSEFSPWYWHRRWFVATRIVRCSSYSSFLHTGSSATVFTTYVMEIGYKSGLE